MKRIKGKRNWFIALFTILNVVAAMLYAVQPRPTSPCGILLIFVLILIVTLLGVISFKALVGASLAEVFLLMLLLPPVLFVLYLRQHVFEEVVTVLSDTWQLWVATEAALAFALLHRRILRIRTPFGEIEMPSPPREIEFEMPD